MSDELKPGQFYYIDTGAMENLSRELAAAEGRAEKAEVELEEYRMRLAAVLTVLDGAPLDITPAPGTPPEGLIPYISHCPTYAAAHRERGKVLAAEADRDALREALKKIAFPRCECGMPAHPGLHEPFCPPVSEAAFIARRALAASEVKP